LPKSAAKFELPLEKPMKTVTTLTAPFRSLFGSIRKAANDPCPCWTEYLRETAERKQ